MTWLLYTSGKSVTVSICYASHLQTGLTFMVWFPVVWGRV